MEMHEEAANASRDAIYCTFAPPGFPDPGVESWISPEASPLWMIGAATHELALGKNVWALQALSMALAGDPSSEALVEEKVKELLSNQSKKPGPKQVPEKLIEIARLYSSCNLHPRALAVLQMPDENTKVDLLEARNELSTAWERLVDEYSKGRKDTCFLFGHSVQSTAAVDLFPSTFAY